ncbi:MAG TPA: transposase [Polyangiaceae bacterium]|nr:transposase [Polyangiaceae bacterium]
MRQAHLAGGYRHVGQGGMRKQYTAEQRAKLIAEVRATGDRVAVVAERMGVASSSAYLWMKAAAPAPGGPVFARVVPARKASLRLEVGGAAVVVEAGFDAELLRQVVVVLGGSA